MSLFTSRMSYYAAAALVNKRPTKLSLNMIESNFTFLETTPTKTFSVLFDNGYSGKVSVTNNNAQIATIATETITSGDIIYLGKGIRTGQTTIKFTSVEYPDLSCTLTVTTSLPIKIQNISVYTTRLDVDKQSASININQTATFWVNSKTEKLWVGCGIYVYNFYDTGTTINITGATFEMWDYNNTQTMSIGISNEQSLGIGTHTITFNANNNGYASNKGTKIGDINIKIDYKKRYGIMVSDVQSYFYNRWNGTADEFILVDGYINDFSWLNTMTFQQFKDYVTSENKVLQEVRADNGANVYYYSDNKLYKSSNEIQTWVMVTNDKYDQYTKNFMYIRAIVTTYQLSA